MTYVWVALGGALGSVARYAFASREDVLEGLRKSVPHDVALQNAPDSDGTFFKVPKVIER